MSDRMKALLDIIEQMLAEWRYLDGFVDAKRARRKYRAKLRKLGFVPIRFTKESLRG